MAPRSPSSEYVTETPHARAALRRERIAAREALPPAEHATLSARIEAHLDRWLSTRPSATIGFCWPIRAEFDARPLVTRLLGAGWHACLPQVVAPGRPMAFRTWTPAAVMAVDRHGIHYPAEGAAAVPDLLLIPVNAFDAAGYRIGYGGGYFDRTLEALAPRPLAIGVGFELARVASIGPRPHDIPLDAVVTELGMLRVPGGRLSGPTDRKP